MNNSITVSRSKPLGSAIGAMHRAQQAGFTLIELLVVMGILSGFLLMLVQLVDSGLRTFRDGETSQILADRSSYAQRVITDELNQLRGSSSTRDSDSVDDRLVVQLLPIGLPMAPERDASRSQILRAAVHLSSDRELGLVDRALVSRILEEDPSLPPEQIRVEVEKRRVNEPLRGVGNVILMVARQEDPDDALIELRAGWFLPGQRFPVGSSQFIDPFEAIVPGGDELPGALLRDLTEPILSNLLHVEFAFWAQGTTAWPGKSGVLQNVLGRRTKTGQGLNEAQAIWDSARGGWLLDDFTGGAFAYDVGPSSENDTSDDIHPHAILVQCVVAQPADSTPEGLLSGFIGSDETSLTLYDGAAFPGAFDGGFIKIGAEWLRYAQLSGDRLIGLRRGQRATKATEHDSGSLIHVGRTIEFVVPILHAKDDWNG